MTTQREQAPSAPGEHRLQAVPGASPRLAGVPDAPENRLTVVNRLPPGEVARAFLVVLGLSIGAYVLWRVQEVLLIFFLSILLATAMEPIVNRLRRGPFSRGSGVLIVYLVLVFLLAIPVYYLLPNALQQAATFVESLPGRIDQLWGMTANLPGPFRGAATSAISRASEAVQSPQAPAEEQIVEAGATAAHLAISFISVFVLAYYWMVERPAIKRALLRAVPEHRARDVNTVWMEVEEKLGGWVRGQLILMAAMGLMAGVGYTVIGLPNAVLLALAAAVFEIVPMIGPILSAAPALLVALAIDPALALVVAVFALVIQQIENNILVPRVMRHTVGISPLTVLLGILAGATLYGLPGAFLAVPIAGGIQVIAAHLLRAEDPSQESTHGEVKGEPPASDGASEAA